MASSEMQPGTEQLTEKSSLRSAFSTDLGPPPGGYNPLYRLAAWIESVPKRHIVAFMAFLGFCNIYALRVNLSVAIVAMVKNRTVIRNGTEIREADFDWDTRTQGLILGSFFYGYIITQLPGGWLANKLGGKYLFGGGVLGTAILTMLTPPAARLSQYCLITLRVIEGLFEGVTYPCIHAIWAKWAPPLERSRLATVAFSGSYAGTVIALPLSGAIAHGIGWPWVFYIFGLFGIIWYCLWLFIVAESPAEHSTITKEELEYIQNSIGFTDEQVKGYKVPWKEILKSLPVWAVIMAHFTENWGFYTFLTELPTFLNDVLHYDMYKAGFVAALPYLAMAIVVQVGGHLADYVRRRGILSTTATRKVTTSGAFVFQMVFLIISAYVMTPVGAVTCITIAVGVGGFAWAGFPVNHLDIAPQYASVLMGLSNTFATIPGVVSPNLTGSLVPDRTAEEWRAVFYIAAAIYCLGAVVYAIFASGEKQQWAEVPVGYQSHIDNTAETSTDHDDLR